MGRALIKPSSIGLNYTRSYQLLKTGSRTIESCIRQSSTAIQSVLFVVVLSTPIPAIPQQYSIDWHTIDGGGEVLAESGDRRWQLSGTLGQWDSSPMLAQSGSGWMLTGGFWPVTVDQTELLFRDSFEG